MERDTFQYAPLQTGISLLYPKALVDAYHVPWSRRPNSREYVDDLVSVRESCKEGAVVRIPAWLVS